MPKLLRILMVEDSGDDAEILERELKRAGFLPQLTRVETEQEYLAELAKLPEIIISDFSMPHFSGLRAAELNKESGNEIPFILVSGTVGEDAAVEAMRLGATDYLLKDRIARLGIAVDRALTGRQQRLEKKQAQEELLWKTTLLEAQVNSAPDAILIVDKSGRRILHNQKLIELFAIPESTMNDPEMDALRKHMASLMKNPTAYLARVEVLYENPDETGQDELELADGRILERFYAPVRDKAGNYYGRIWNMRDITEKRKLEEQYRQAQKMEAIGQLAAGVAHDFNNILAVIQMQAGLLRAESEFSSIHAELADEIEKAADRATHLTRQLLLFGRRQSMKMVDLDLNNIVSNVGRMLRRVLGEQIQIKTNLLPRPLIVHADPGMLDQILMNLAVNARDAMPRGGSLIFETKIAEFPALDASNKSPKTRIKPGLYASLSVKDTGTGIAPEILSKIFEPFFTTKELGKGTGLGLATVFGIVQQHHGWINAESEQGKGSTFFVHLPLRDDVAPIPEQKENDSALRQGNETILLVEDDNHLRASERKMLEKMGYRVLEATNGGEALAIWEKQSKEIALVLTDLVMPGNLTGKEMADLLLKKKPGLKIIYTSGYSAEIGNKEFDIEHGVNFIPKPFQGSQLAQVIRRMLDRKN